MTDRPEDPIRVALIGYGLAGAVFHGPLISSSPGMSLTTIVTGDPGRRARASSDHPDTRLLGGADALWQQAADHDLVVVATPNRSHVPLGLAALEAGLPVVIDKPMAPTAEGGRRLLAEATERELLLTVFQNRRWDGDFLTVRRLLSEDALGPIVRFESSFERWRPNVRPEAWRERGDPEEAGGLLFDLGSHLIDQALVLFGPVAEVYAEVDRRRPGVVVDDDAFVALAHASGVRSHLWMSAAAAQMGPRFRVLGSRAAFVKVGLDVQEEQLRGGARPGSAGFGEEPRQRWGQLGKEKEWTPVPTERGAYAHYYAGVAAALRGGAPPPVDPADSVAGLEIIEAARRSSAERAVVRLDAR